MPREERAQGRMKMMLELATHEIKEPTGMRHGDRR
jgi:hypothetical protein